MLDEGNPFVIFKLEDYAGSVEMALFGDDYVRLGQYIEAGRFLQITGKTQNKWNSNDLEFRPSSIRLLTELRDKLCKEVRVSLTLDVLTPQLIARTLLLPGGKLLHVGARQTVRSHARGKRNDYTRAATGKNV